ncbi:MAG: outer membrane protein TolC [Parasphingorhabdus sp.]|jgi:outer membrane protein TolC
MKFTSLIKPVIASTLATLFITGCTSMPVNQGLDDVQFLVQQQSGTSLTLPMAGSELQLSEQEVTKLLAFPLKIKDAEKIALHRNALLKVKLANVGLAAADYAQAGRMENPGFSLARFSSEDFEATTLFDIGGIVLMPLRRKIAARQLQSAQYRAAGDVLDHLKSTRDLWIKAVTEIQKTRLMEEVLEAGETTNELTRQMTAIGHSSKRESGESELALVEMRTALSRQRIVEISTHEQLVQALGIWGSDASIVVLPDKLQLQPEKPIPYEKVAEFAVRNRLDVQIAKLELEGMANNLKLTKRSPFFNVIELGSVLEKVEGEKERGFEIEFSLPLFDWGGIKTEKARIAFLQAEAQAQSTVVSAASQARDALHAYRRTWDIANAYSDQVLPIQEALNREELLRYNGMLISVFDLLKNAKKSLQIKIRQIEALRDFWLADNRLRHTLVAAGNSSMQFTSPSMASSGDADEGGH